MTFDRLLYIDRLKEAGVEEPIARAHAEALRDALSETVATKTDLKDQGAALRAEMKDLGTALRGEMRDLATVTDRKIDALDRKIELIARDLTIKGAGGLIIIASLMIGLKIFIK